MYSFDTFCFTKWGKAMLKFSLMLPYSWNNDPRCFHSEAYSLIINHWQRISPRYRTMVSVSVSRLKVRSLHPYVKPLSGFMSTVFDQVLTVNSIHLCCDHTLNTSLHLPTPLFFLCQWCPYPSPYGNCLRAAIHLSGKSVIHYENSILMTKGTIKKTQ